MRAVFSFVTWLITGTISLIGGAFAAQQEWVDFTVPELGLMVEFPGAPTRSWGTYKTVLVPSAPTHIFSYTTENAVYTATVVDLLDREREGANLVLEAAYLMTLTGSDTRMDNTARVSPGAKAVYGRLITVDLKHAPPPPEGDAVLYPTQGALNWLRDATGLDFKIGSSSTTSIYFTRGRLYLIQGVNLPVAVARAANAMRFAQSLSWAFPDYLAPEGAAAN